MSAVHTQFDHYASQSYYRISFPFGRLKKIIYSSDIVYIRADGNYSIFITVCGQKIISSKTLKYWENLLDFPIFMRCHQSFIINRLHVNSTDFKTNIFMNNNDVIAISRRYSKKMKSRVGLFPSIA